MSLRSGSSHRSRVIFPGCQISNFLFFFQAWELFHDITHFLKQHLFLPLFPIVLVTNLITLITCQHLPNLISGHCQKFFSQNFNFTLLDNYIRLLNFLFNPSCTTLQTNIVTGSQTTAQVIRCNIIAEGFRFIYLAFRFS